MPRITFTNPRTLKVEERFFDTQEQLNAFRDALHAGRFEDTGSTTPPILNRPPEPGPPPTQPIPGPQPPQAPPRESVINRNQPASTPTQPGQFFGYPEGTTVEQGLEIERSRFKNILDVYKAIIDPSRRVVSNLDNRVFNTAAEYMANHPISSMAMLMGGGGLIRFGAKKLGKFAIGKSGQLVQTTLSAEAPAFAVNTKVAGQTTSLLAGVMANMKKPLYVLGAVSGMIGTYPWAEWSRTEAIEIMSITYRDAIKSGNPEIIAETQKYVNEIYDPGMFDNISRLIPGVNLATQFKKKTDAAVYQRRIFDQLAEDEIEKINNNETEEQYYQRTQKKEKESFEYVSSYNNESRKLYKQWELEAEAEARRLQREADAAYRQRQREADFALFQKKRQAEIKARNEDARFWAEQRKLQAEQEARDREELAKFWFEYRKQQELIRQNNMPSQLNFGFI